jgi:hypothetical protein
LGGLTRELATVRRAARCLLKVENVSFLPQTSAKPCQAKLEGAPIAINLRRLKFSGKYVPNLVRLTLTCPRCSVCWVPGLNRPAGRCSPVIGRDARILGHWQAHIANSAPTIASRTYPSRPSIRKVRVSVSVHAQSTDRMFGKPFAASEPALRGTNALARCTPGPAVQRRSCSRARSTNGSADDDMRQSAPPYAPSEWPHFGNYFLDYESIINRVGREFFGDMPRTSIARIPWAQTSAN